MEKVNEARNLLEALRAKMKNVYFNLPRVNADGLETGKKYESRRPDDRRGILATRILKTKLIGKLLPEGGKTVSSETIEISLKAYRSSGIGTGKSERALPEFVELSEEFLDLYEQFAAQKAVARELEEREALEAIDRVKQKWMEQGIDLSGNLIIKKAHMADEHGKLVMFTAARAIENSRGEIVGGFIFTRILDKTEITITADEFETYPPQILKKGGAAQLGLGF